MDTQSAVAYCDNGKADDDITSIRVIQEWPGNKATLEKVPSRISYGPPPEVAIKWGYLIKPNDKARPHALMKLKLDERLRKSKQLRLLLQFLASGIDSLSLNDLDSDDEDGPPEYPGKSPVDVVADYLSEVRASAYKTLEMKYGAELFSMLNKVLVITVPAVWSEHAKDQTLKAVTKSNWGASKIGLVTEPEAAAIYTLKYMNQGVNRDQVTRGDSFVLCDAGGGTVDLISYKVTNTTPHFAIEEAVVGSGDKCGATYVDQEFLSWLKSWLGEEAFNLIPEQKLRHGSRLMNDFELAKNGFSGVEDDMEVQLPRECGIEDDEEKGIEDYSLTINW
jgi:molecular chaperone DnaK (HSP70)